MLAMIITCLVAVSPLAVWAGYKLAVTHIGPADKISSHLYGPLRMTDRPGYEQSDYQQIVRAAIWLAHHKIS